LESFDKEVDEVLSVISTFPKAFRSGSGKQIHEAFIKPWNILIYRVRKGRVELLAFWDTRRDPRKKPKFSSWRSRPE